MDAITKTAEQVGVSDEYARQLLAQPQYSFKQVADAHREAAELLWSSMEHPAMKKALREILATHLRVMADTLLEAKRAAAASKETP